MDPYLSPSYKQFGVKHQFKLLTYGWLTPLLKKLQKNSNYQMQAQDIPFIPPNLRPQHSSSVIARNFNISKKKLLLPMLFKSNKTNLVIMGFYAVFLALCGITLPLALNYFTGYFTPGVFYDCELLFSDNPKFIVYDYNTSLVMLLQNLIGWVICFFVAEFLYVYAEQACISKSIEVGVSSSSGLMDLMYNKIIKLNECSRQKAANGNVVNLLFSDTQIIIMFFSMFYWIILLPLNMIACIFFVIFQIDAAGLAGFVGMFITFGASTFFLMQYFKASDKAFSVRDQRISRTQEIVNGIKVIKFFVFEKIQEQRVENIRKKEIKLYKKQNILYSLLYADSIITLPMMTLVPFIILFFQQKFTYSAAVTISFSFQLVSNSVTSMPLLFALWSQAAVSSRRIQSFFKLSEQEEGVVVQRQMEDAAIRTEGLVSFTWGLKQDQVTPAVLDPLYEQKQNIIKQVTKLLPKLNKNLSKYRIELQAVDALLSELGIKKELSKQELDQLCEQLGLPTISQITGIEQYDASKYEINKKSLAQKLQIVFIQIKVIEKLLHANNIVVEDMPDSLTDLNFSIKKKELVGLCGKVASGKTSVFQAILGEMRLSPSCRESLDQIIEINKEEYVLENEYKQKDNRVVKLIENDSNIPHIYVDGKIAYCPQQPTILSATIRDNILFGNPFDQQKYNLITELCCLIPDFKAFDEGDQTYVGSRGINLSGGQKARVSLARAVYADADIYLLDDPLSAVDANVGAKIWQGVVMGYLSQKTVLIASHQTHFFTDCHRIMWLEDGQIQGFDTLENIRKLGNSINTLIEETSSFSDSQKRLNELSVVQSEYSAVLGSKPQTNNIIGKTVLEDDPIQLPEHAEVFTEETYGGGSIPWGVYKRWFGAGSKFLICSFILFLACAQAVLQYQQIVISDWTSDTYNWNRDYAKNVDPTAQCTSVECKKYVRLAFDLLNGDLANHKDYSYFKDGLFVCATNIYGINTDPDQQTSVKYLILYACLTLVLMFFGFIGYTSQANFSLSASKEMHQKMIYALIHQPVKFFDKNSQGKIMNRVSKDVDSLDNVLLKYFFDLIYDIMGITGVIVQIIILNVVSLVVIIPFIVACVWLFFKLRKSVPQIKRYETICRTPVFNTCVETLTNLITIRSFGKANYFQQQYRDQVLQSTAMTFAQRCTNRWYSIRFGMFATIFATVVPFLSLFYGPLSQSSVLYSGQIVSMSQGICFLLTYYINALMQLEGEMPSVERILEFSDLKIESQEGKTITDPSWPKKNSIVELQNVKFQYDKGQKYILKGINFKLTPGEHVGVVGRTGAGKTTVTLSMFRFNEPEGQILVDGINILELKLDQSRKCFSIIPQEPFLFSGTLRQNLCTVSQAQAEGIEVDPAKRLTDEQLWNALDKVKMREHFESTEEGLDFLIQPMGANLSSGQRQLVCVSRAILQNASCIILDEATAFVDREKDKIIQQTIKEALEGITVLSIAHRLNTIIDFDRIIVLDAGNIVEFDTPANLIRNKGYFANMIDRTGIDMAESLKASAFAEEQKKLQKI